MSLRPASAAASGAPDAKRPRLAAEDPAEEHRVVQRTRDAAGCRVVPPYLHAFTAFTKQRWCGRRILDVFTSDFASHSAEYFEAAIRRGAITVSKGGPGKAASSTPQTVGPDYVLVDGDYLMHRVHRHEPPVPGDPIEVLVSGDGAPLPVGGAGAGYQVHAEGLPPGLVVLNKPAGMPVHSCGPYKFNTILSCAVAELGMPLLSPAHRLDRVTSGILLLGRTSAATATMSAWIRDKRLRKVYVARVEGDLQPPPQFDASAVPTTVSEAVIATLLAAADAETSAGDSSAQTEGAAPTGGSPLVDEAATAACPWLSTGLCPRISWEDMLAAGGEGEEGGETAAVLAAASSSSAADSSAAAVTAPRVHVPSHTVGWTVPLAGMGSSPVADAVPYPASVSRWLRVAVPTLATDPKHGRHGAAREGDAVAGVKAGDSRRARDGPKASVTLFRPFAWGTDAAGRPYTVVEAVPLSGRTHQLRVHLAWLGHGIANDPLYCSAAAKELLAAVARQDAAAEAEKAAAEEGAAAAASGTSNAVLQHGSTRGSDSGSEEALPVLRSLCNYCTKGPAAEFSVFQRGCMGVWLHSIEYSGPGWRVSTPVPAWASGGSYPTAPPAKS